MGVAVLISSSIDQLVEVRGKIVKQHDSWYMCTLKKNGSIFSQARVAVMASKRMKIYTNSNDIHHSYHFCTT